MYKPSWNQELEQPAVRDSWRLRACLDTWMFPFEEKFDSGTKSQKLN